ncbi:MAG TPA: amidohydrolase family protein [Deltaproteobacteria bacterium]|nr:amidohydrolase family protein [Deltaproteobacteria bacterium]
MIIDCHYHLEEKVFSEDALLREMDASGVEKNALMGSMVAPFHEPPRFLISIMQALIENSITRPLAKVFVSNFTDRGEVKILGKPYFVEPDPDNRKVFDAVKRHPDRFLGWVFVNPRGRKDPVAEFERYSDSPGFIGVKAHPFWHHFRPVELAPVAMRLAATGKPLLLHVGFGEEGDYEALLAHVPNLSLILAHAGFPEYGDTWARIRGRSNVYLDLSQTSYTSERATREAVAYMGPDRLFFGTDGPYGFHGPDGRYDYGFIKRRIERLFPDRELQAKLLGGNFARLVGLV